MGSSLTVDIESLDSMTCLIKRTQTATDNASIDKDLSFLRNVDEMEQIQLSTITLPNQHHVTNHVFLILYIHFALLLVSNPTSTFSFSGLYYKRTRSNFFKSVERHSWHFDPWQSGLKIILRQQFFVIEVWEQMI